MAKKAYVPGEFDQRPPLEEIEKRMHKLLDSALIHGFATGSIGTTFVSEDDHFVYNVSYTIRRKKRKGIRVHGSRFARAGEKAGV